MLSELVAEGGTVLSGVNICCSLIKDPESIEQRCAVHHIQQNETFKRQEHIKMVERCSNPGR